ncbi:MAG: SMP-30/gluconolactonase/LRE family protein [Oceanospirillaceae bacterium]|nr:SMP-30/gluconolactonase/LRE family protein [Oceanospirillaceae bacterium]
MNNKKLIQVIFCALLATPALAKPELEVAVEWNSFSYDVKDSKVKAVWEASDLYGKALVQGVKLDSHGTMYVSTARWGGASMPSTLSKLVKKADEWVLQAFPSQELNNVANPLGLKSVLGFEIDRNNVMWILDQGHIGGSMSAGDAKLILWDIDNNKEIQRHVFSNEVADQKCSFLNDLAVDNDTGVAYIADSGIFCDPLHGGLIVYDSKTQSAKRVLDQSKFTSDDPNFFFNIGERVVTKGGAMRTGADGIALSSNKETLYWTNLTGNSLYSLPTKLLRDFSTEENTIEGAVNLEITLPSNTDGMTFDNKGNLYMTALTLDGVMKYNTATGKLSRFIHHPEMLWPDTLAWGPDDALYITSNQLHVWVDGEMDFESPKVPNFRIWKIKNVGKSYTSK